MASKRLIATLGVIAAALPLAAAIAQSDSTSGAPAGGPETRYCMRVEPVTGTRIEKVECWTRQEWAEQGVDVDKDWPQEGVRTVG